MAYLFFWLTFSVVAGVVAHSKGRSAIGYFALSMLLSPLVGLVLAIALPSRIQALTPDALKPAARIHCPQCAELILPQAKIFRFCQAPLVPAEPAKASELHDDRGFGLWGVLSRLLSGKQDSHRYPPE